MEPAVWCTESLWILTGAATTFPTKSHTRVPRLEYRMASALGPQQSSSWWKTNCKSNCMHGATYHRYCITQEISWSRYSAYFLFFFIPFFLTCSNILIGPPFLSFPTGVLYPQFPNVLLVLRRVIW
jgi:hypothetical protein